MTPDRWARVKEVLANVLEKAGEERGVYLNEACGADEGLRREVESLLAKEQDSWLASPLKAAKMPELITGQVLGRYRVEVKLGQGGMGAVYKAHDSVLRRPVALKVLPPGQLADPEGREWLTREARAASALNHPNIITVHDISSENGVDFIAMELVEGQPLSDLIPVGGMPVAQALHYAMQVARGLVKAHRAGIVHRDLKPGNIMVTSDGLVKLLDFGLARRARITAASATTGSLTAEGVISGTPSYMSPEQAQGKPVDARSDIFSFGTVLYEMVSGRKAFHSDSQISTLAAVIHEQPPPLDGSIPVDLAKLIARCIRKDPERRFQHMDDVRVTLEDLEEESESGARRAGRYRWLLLTGVLVAVLLILIGINVFRPPPVISAPIPLTSLMGQEESPSFSPDGTQVAFAHKAGELGWHIYVQVIGSGAPYQRTNNPASDLFPAWSPDGRAIAFLRKSRDKQQIVLVPPIGGSEKVLVETAPLVGAEYPRPGWTPDGKWLAYSEPVSPGKPHAIVLISMETGEKRKLTTPPPGSGDEAPAFSPDGRTMAFARGSFGGHYDILLLDLSKSQTPRGEPHRLTSPDHVNHLPAWTADSHELVYSASRGARQIPPSMVLRRIRVGGLLPSLWRRGRKAELVPLTGADTEGPAISFTHRRLAYTQYSPETSIWRVNVGDSPQLDRAERLIDSTRDESSPQFSPDGRRITFVSNRSGTAEVWVCDQDGSNPEQLTSLGAAVSGFPRWSPDGQQIVFDSNPEGVEQIYVIPARGAFPRRLTNERFAAFGASWSRDGRWIYYSSAGGVWKIPPVGGSPVQVVKEGNLPAESHDGKFLHYCRGSDAWKVPVEGGEETRVFEGVWMGIFTVTEKGTYFIPPPAKAGRNSLRFFDFATGKSRLVAAIDSRLWIGLTASPDGRTVLFSKQDKYASDLMLMENFQ